MADENIAIELAQLREQMKAMAESVERIETNVSQIMQLDRTIAEMGVHNTHMKQELETMWAHMSDHKKWAEAHDRASSDNRTKITSEIQTVDNKIEGIVNRGRGALWAFGIMFVVVQGSIAGSILWVFSHVNDSDSINRVQQYRIEQLEKFNK